jgi:hypothetical protein
MAIEGSKVITSEATLSYPNLLIARAGQKPGSKSKFSASLVFFPEQLKTPAGKATIAAINAAVLAVATAKFGATGAEMIKKGKLNTPLRDDAEAKDYPAGSLFLNARTELKPACVFAYASPESVAEGTPKPLKMTDEEIKTLMYAGAKVRASLTFFYYDVEGNKGIGVALNNLQKVGEGTRIDGRKAAEDEFDVDLSVAPVDISKLV